MFETNSGVIKPIVYLGIVKKDKLLLVDYKNPPNSNKTGWWIPAPALEFAEDPKEAALKTIADFGFKGAKAELFDVESFVTPGGWHLITHFICHVKSEPQEVESVKAYKWVKKHELAEMKDLAHGQWEIELGKKFLKDQT